MFPESAWKRKLAQMHLAVWCLQLTLLKCPPLRPSEWACDHQDQHVQEVQNVDTQPALWVEVGALSDRVRWVHWLYFKEQADCMCSLEPSLKWCFIGYLRSANMALQLHARSCVQNILNYIPVRYSICLIFVQTCCAIPAGYAYYLQPKVHNHTRGVSSLNAWRLSLPCKVASCSSSAQSSKCKPVAEQQLQCQQLLCQRGHPQPVGDRVDVALVGNQV